MRALRERPPAGAIPAQFLQLSDKNKHAIAIDSQGCSPAAHEAPCGVIPARRPGRTVRKATPRGQHSHLNALTTT